MTSYDETVRTISNAWVAGRTPSGRSLNGFSVNGLRGIVWSGPVLDTAAPQAVQVVEVFVRGDGACRVASRSCYATHEVGYMDVEAALDLAAAIVASLDQREWDGETGRPIDGILAITT